MLDIFNLDTYKDYLISYCFYGCDIGEDKRLDRQKLLESRYSDEYLHEIVENTKEFVLYLLENTKNNYVSIDMDFEVEHIFTNLTGGYHPDILVSIEDSNGHKKISKYLLDKFLGKGFYSYFDTDETEVYDDKDEDFVIGCIYETPKFIIIGNFPEKLEQLKKEKQVELIRTLKKPQ